MFKLIIEFKVVQIHAGTCHFLKFILYKFLNYIQRNRIFSCVFKENRYTVFISVSNQRKCSENVLK